MLFRSDGPFIYTGFRPRWVLLKRTDTASVNGWYLYDGARNPYNNENIELYPNLSSAETTSSAGIDALANGFKVRNNSSDYNASGGTFIYAAFAENPFKIARAR